MAHFFRTPDRRQRFLLPVDMMEWLLEDDIIHLIVDAVGLMDLSKFEATCKVGGAGQPPFAPAMLLTVLIYAYSHGVRSSRVIERLCRRDAGYRFIVGDEVPDHTVIARFRQRHVGQMTGVFLQVLDLCREAGLIRLGLVALDGTKVKANAALDVNRTASTIAEQVSRMLAEAEATDAQEDRQFGAGADGPAMPKGLGRHADRLARLTACQEKLKARAARVAGRAAGGEKRRARAAAAAARQQEKIAAREAEETASGQRKRGRKPKVPDASVDPDRVANPTDPDSAPWLAAGLQRAGGGDARADHPGRRRDLRGQRRPPTQWHARPGAGECRGGDGRGRAARRRSRGCGLLVGGQRRQPD